MAKKGEQFVVYVGEGIINTTNDLKKAKEIYNDLPSGKGKRPSLRRSLVKEQVVMCDERV